MFPIEVPDNFRIIAHRGASGYAPENTLPAFDLALRMGVREVETDTQLTRDGAVVLCHDAMLDRYGYPDLCVEQQHLSELQDLDMGSWFSPYQYGGTGMMTLAELLDRYGDTLCYHVELKGKSPGLPQAVHEVIRQAGLGHRCFVTSFSYEHLERMRKIDAALPLGWLVREIGADGLDKASAVGLIQLCPRAADLTADAVQACRGVVQEVRAWGLGGGGQQVSELVHGILAAGCDGVTINWPDWLRHPSSPG